jgi:uncharacterized protein (TIGR03435 family)
MNIDLVFPGGRVPLLFLAMIAAAHAQSGAFEAISIRTSDLDPRASGILKPSPGGLTAINYPLEQYIAWAYGIRSDFILGPDWLGRPRFDIAARTSEATSPDALRPMLRKALEERFHLAAHHETRPMPVYALVVAKGGPKHFAKASPAVPSTMEPGPLAPDGSRVWLCRNTTMASFTGLMARPGLDRPLIDATALEGGFDFTFRFPPDESAATRLDYLISSVFPAVTEQLGLKIEARKVPADVLVVDLWTRSPRRIS